MNSWYNYHIQLSNITLNCCRIGSCRLLCVLTQCRVVLMSCLVTYLIPYVTWNSLESIVSLYHNGQHKQMVCICCYAYLQIPSSNLFENMKQLSVHTITYMYVHMYVILVCMRVLPLVVCVCACMCVCVCIILCIGVSVTLFAYAVLFNYNYHLSFCS